MELYHPQLQTLASELYELSGRIFYKRKPGQGRPLLVYGWTGCGKTHSAHRMQSWFDTVRMSIGPVMGVDQDGKENSFIPDCTFANWPEVVDGFKQGHWGIIDRLKDDYFVILDDIGAEHDPSGIGQEKLCQILSRREHMHTLITTNVQPENFAAKWQQRIASRLFRNTVEVDLRDVPDFSTKLPAD